MKRFLSWAILAVALLILMAPIVYAQAPAEPDAQTLSLIWMSAGSIAAFVAGLLVKRIPALPNETIPYLTCGVAIAGYVVLMGMPVKEAVILAMATAHGATLVAEGGKLVAKKPGVS